MDFNLTDVLNFLAITVTSGVVTALAIHIALGAMEDKAVSAAKAELEMLIIASQPAPAQATYSEPIIPAPDNNAYLIPVGPFGYTSAVG